MEASSVGILGVTCLLLNREPHYSEERTNRRSSLLPHVSLIFQYRLNGYLEPTNSQSSLRNGQDQVWYMGSKYQNRLGANKGKSVVFEERQVVGC